MRLRPGERIWNPTPSMRHLTLLPVKFRGDRPTNFETWMTHQEWMLLRLVSEAKPYEIKEVTAYLAEKLPELTVTPNNAPLKFPQRFLSHWPAANLAPISHRIWARGVARRP